MKTVLYIIENEKDFITIAKKCLKNSISFECMNGNEMYFTIFDDNYFEVLQTVLGEKIINHKNIV